MFGNNPAETRMSGGGQIHNYVDAKILATRTICIDPRYTDTAAGREDQWIPIKHGTDAALVAAIAHVLISEDKVDQDFLDRYCVGYDRKLCQHQRQKMAATKITSWVQVRMVSRKRQSGHNQSQVFLLM